MNPHIFTSKPQKEYALLDSGDGMKLERYGDAQTGVKVARPDPQALWRKNLSEKEWRSADAYFAKDKDANKKSSLNESGESESERGKWVISRPNLPETWPISFGDLKMNIKLTPFKHTGIFPEQLNNWLWCREVIKDEILHRKGKLSQSNSQTDSQNNQNNSENPDNKPTVLNLFGYTGGASLSAALGGASVTHVDASRAAITWANDNAKSSGLEEAPIRWILDDAFAFVKREIRRGKKYDAIIMDPPSYGRGAKGEIWKIEDHFLDFFEDCLKLLSDTPLFVVVNGYAAGYSAIAYANNMKVLTERYGGTLESGELTLTAEDGRILPCGIVSRWKK